MYHSIHSEFIETPLLRILEEGIQACRPLGDGIQTEPMKEYFLSSLFLRMTGAQEQKLKCICWELATHDYEFRYKEVFGKSSFGEMSSKEDKQKLYKVLQNFIKRSTGEVKEHCYLDRGDIEQLRDEIADLLEASPTLKSWLNPALASIRDVAHFMPQDAEPKGKGSDKNRIDLLGEGFWNNYSDVVYRYRNRCAHNLTSYQRSCDSLDSLSKRDYLQHNYVYRFIILILIDNIFMALYKEYRNHVEMDPWR